jgi:hypothetical protein
MPDCIKRELIAVLLFGGELRYAGGIKRELIAFGFWGSAITFSLWGSAIVFGFCGELRSYLGFVRCAIAFGL